MPVPSYLQAHAGGTRLAVKVVPRASRNELAGVLGGTLKIRITAPPVDAAANEALVKYVSDLLACPRHQVELVRGHASRNKILHIHGLTPEMVAGRLT